MTEFRWHKCPVFHTDSYTIRTVRTNVGVNIIAKNCECHLTDEQYRRILVDALIDERKTP